MYNRPKKNVEYLKKYLSHLFRELWKIFESIKI